MAGATNQSSELRLFIPLTKVDIEKRLVYGIATAEEEDLSGEVCDYASTKPFYEKWSADVHKASGGKSRGNVRSMHGPTAAGKVVDISFDDDARKIEICAKVVDDNEWQKVQEGVYTGFSQGGRYVKRWDDKGVSKYTADPSEVSLVDLPCLPTATFSVIKGADLVEKRAFTTVIDEPDPDAIKDEARALAGTGRPWHDFAEEATAKLFKSAMNSALAKILQPKEKSVVFGDATGDATDVVDPTVVETEKPARKFFEPKNKWDCGCADHTHMLKAEAVSCMKKSAADRDAAAAAAPAVTALEKIEAELGLRVAKIVDVTPARALKKGLPTVGRLASLIQELYWVQKDTAVEADCEKDNSPLPAALQTSISELSVILVQMAQEETSELFQANEGGATDFSSMMMAAGLSEGQINALEKISKVTPELEKLGSALEKTQGEAVNRTIDRFVTEVQTLVKAGARNSAADADRLQKCHDMLCELGATCDDGDGQDDEGADDVDKLKAENEGLKKSVSDIEVRLGTVLDKVAELSKRAAPAKAAIHSVGADTDSSGQSSANPSSDQITAALKALSPAEQTMVLMKMSLANPVPVIK